MEGLLKKRAKGKGQRAKGKGQKKQKKQKAIRENGLISLTQGLTLPFAFCSLLFPLFLIIKKHLVVFLPFIVIKAAFDQVTTAMYIQVEVFI